MDFIIPIVFNVDVDIKNRWTYHTFGLSMS